MRFALATLLLFFGCRPANRPNDALVVTPAAVDGGALVTISGQSSGENIPEGCPSRSQLALDALKLEAALRDRFGVGWNAVVEENESITASPTTPLEEQADTSARFLDAIRTTFPDLILGEPRVDGHRGTVFHCWPALVKTGLVARTHHAVCIQIEGLVVDMVRLDLSRNLAAFAPLLRCTEEEAKSIALTHARTVLKQHEPRAHNVQLIAACDAERRATSLMWSVDADSEGYLDAIYIDAKTRTVIDAKVHQLGD